MPAGEGGELQAASVEDDDGADEPDEPQDAKAPTGADEERA